MRYTTHILTALYAAAFACTATGVTLHVAPDGNDSWSGQLPVANGGRTDGPLATLAGARNAVRRLKAAQGLDSPVHVQFQTGVYGLASPVLFTPEDSGTAACPVFYEAAAGAKPVFSGAVELKGFREERGLWTVDVPMVKRGECYFRSLFVNGRRAPRARTPNKADGYLHIEAKAAPLVDRNTGAEVSREKTAFIYRRGDLKTWRNWQDVDLVVFDAWDVSILPMLQLDEVQRVVSFSMPNYWRFMQWDTRYYVENAPDALDAPGEWILDRAAGELSVVPRAAQQIETTAICAPRLRQFILLQGDAAAGTYVEHLRFIGLSFVFGDWLRHIRFSDFPRPGGQYAFDTGRDDGPEGGYNSLQAAFQVPGAISAEWARNCVFEACDIGHVGLYAFDFPQGCRDLVVRGNHLHHLGAGGVKIGLNRTLSDAAVTSHITVANNFIHHGGEVYPAAVGVWIGRSSHNKILHNEISDFTYSGISAGWDWGYSPSSAHHNAIEYNHIHRIGRGYLSDMGGIYTLGISTGTTLRHNVIHDLHCYKYGATGIYLDQSSSGILVENNVCFRCQTGGFTIHYGKDNVVRNNIFAFGTSHQISLGRPEEHKALTFERNLVCYREGVLAGHRWTQGTFNSDHNLYWDYSGTAVQWAKMGFVEWQSTGRDLHSAIADPLFVDPERADFALRAESPARALGFSEIEVSKAGLVGDGQWVRAPQSIEPLPMEPKPRPRPVRDDFEARAVGTTPADGVVYGANEQAWIRISAESAAGGKQSLRFQDSAALQDVYNPHLVYSPNFSDGRLRMSCDLRVEPGALPVIEWRDWTVSPFRIGPSLAVDAAGQLKANGKALTPVPRGEWFHLEINCQLGSAFTGTYDVRLELADGTEQHWERLSCGYPKFSQVTWLGFVSDAAAATVFDVDNVDIDLVRDE